MICYSCMNRVNSNDICPICGEKLDIKNAEVFIPVGTILADRFVIGKVLDKTTFLTTYVAYDTNLNRVVDITELFPQRYSYREKENDSYIVEPVSKEAESQYNQAKECFMEEGAMLLKHTNEIHIQRVYEQFAENNTVYRVMEHLQGRSVAEILEEEGPFNKNSMAKIVSPIFKVLINLHDEKIYHKNICPKNIFVTKDNVPKLIRFESTRFAVIQHSSSSKSMTEDGYSPFELYHQAEENGNHGSWSDVYSMASTIYTMLTGDILESAVDREENSLKLNIKGLDKNKKNALLNALNIDYKQRTKDFKMFYNEFLLSMKVLRKKEITRDMIRRRRMRMMLASAAVFVVAVITLFLTGVIGPERAKASIVENRIDANKVAAPNVIGKNVEESSEILVSKNLSMQIISGKSYHPKVPNGYVFIQTPDVASLVNRSEAIEVQISAGKEMVLMPNVTLMNKAQGLSLLEANKFIIEIIEEETNNAANDTILSQSVMPNELIAKESAVTITVSKNNEEKTASEDIEIPDVKGETIENAKKILQESNLFAQLSYENSDDIPEGIVISQGNEIDEYSVVKLKVSSGKKINLLPDLQYNSLDVAQEMLSEYDIDVSTTENYNDAVAAGLVMSQSIAPNTQIYDGMELKLEISQGSRQVDIPLVVGLDYDTAVKNLNDAGFYNLFKEEEYSSEYDKGVVMSCLPEGSASLGSLISMVVSKGEARGKTVTVPDVTGMNVDEAAQFLKDMKLNVTIEKEYSDTVAVDIIIWQDPLVDSVVDEYATVTIVKSQGLKKVVVPDVTGLDISIATKTLENSGLVVSTTRKYSDTVPINNIISQDHKQGSEVEVGTEIKLVVSDGLEVSEDQLTSVPSLVGLTISQARSKISEAELNISESYVYSNSVAKDVVIKQGKTSGTKVKKYSSISVTVSKGKEDVVVPSVVGQTENNAKSIISNASLNYSIEYRSSEDVQKGLVIQQTPAAGTKAQPGTVLTVYVSSGVGTIKVPNVVGKTEAEAKQSVTSAGLSYDIQYQSSNTVAKGVVINQSPVKGQQVTANTKVTIVVSNGAFKTTVPNVVGKTESLAISDITAAKLKYSIEYKNSSTVDSGLVISQSPSSSQQVNENTYIAIVVSSGPKMVTVPNVVGKTEAEAISSITGAGLKSNVVYESSSSVAEGYVIKQDKSAGTQLEENQQVSIHVSTGVQMVDVPNLVGMGKDEAINALNNIGLGYSFTEYNDNHLPAQQVTSQNKAAGTKVAIGTQLQLDYCLGPYAWSEYTTDLPQAVLDNPENYDVEEKDEYRSRDQESSAGDWTEWSTTQQTENVANSETQYSQRTRTKEYLWSTQSTTDLPDWTYSGESRGTGTYTSWSSWSSWSTTNPGSETSTRDVETKTIHKYNHFYFRTNEAGNWTVAAYDQYNLVSRGLTNWYDGYHYYSSETALPYLGKVMHEDGYHSYYGNKTCSQCGHSTWYNHTTETQYRKRTRSEIEEYKYWKWNSWSDWGAWVNGSAPANTDSEEYKEQYRYKLLSYYWGSWSNWQDASITPSDTKQVEERKVYKYRIK